MHNFEKNSNSSLKSDAWTYDLAEEQRKGIIADKVERICEREKLSPDVGKIAVESCVNAIGKTPDVLQLIDHLAPDVVWLDRRVNANIPQNVLDESYLLIGPMGTGKSTIARKLAEQTNMPKISLDSRADLPDEWRYVERRHLGTESRDAYITTSALTELKEPTIVDFGAGDSVYDDPLIKHEMDTLISRFKNVVLILPGSDRSASLAYLNGRVRNREPQRRGFEGDNGRFVYAPNNQQLAKRTVYTNFGDKSPDETAREIASFDAVE